MSLYLGTTPIANDGSHNTANVDLSNLSNTGEAHFANPALTNSPYTTNRILEIPQNIKLELNNGTLTLKAGSKVYVPNGVGVFEVKTAQQDFTMMRNTNAKELVFVRWSGDNITSLDAWTFCYSGSSAPSSEPFMAWYDTSNNVVKGTANGGSTWTETLSFSIAAISEDSTKITSIDQVFNGFGYIGSTVFVLPGVKVQIPYGKNQDGTFHHGSEGYISKKVLTLTRTSIALSNWSVWSDAWGGEIQNLYYVRAFKTVKTLPTSDNSYTKIFNEEDGYYYYTGSETKPVKSSVGGFLVASNVSCDANGKVTSFSPYTTVDSVANSNASNFSQAGRSYLSGLGMPSGRYIDLTLGASGSTYTAPANGYFNLAKVSGGVEFINGLNHNTLYYEQRTSAGVDMTETVVIPARKGDTVAFLYNMTGSTLSLRFIYAEGDQ